MNGTDFGCRFSLYPMCDDFISIILGALEKTDISAVYSFTDRVSTVYQGGTDSVVDAVKGLFVNAFADGVHMCLEGVFSNREKAEKVPLPQPDEGKRCAFSGKGQSQPVLPRRRKNTVGCVRRLQGCKLCHRPLCRQDGRRYTADVFFYGRCNFRR